MKDSLRQQKNAAFKAGKQARIDGAPCVAPTSPYRQIEASWRIGWRTEALNDVAQQQDHDQKQDSA